jgi:hypothetical protein
MRNLDKEIENASDLLLRVFYTYHKLIQEAYPGYSHSMCQKTYSVSEDAPPYCYMFMCTDPEYIPEAQRRLNYDPEDTLNN